MRSKEYLEFYGDEALKSAVVTYLRGSGAHSKEELLRRVKSSAVKVESKHFEGYNALVAIITTPQRSGVSLIARELALAQTGKKDCMYTLIRNLSLSRLFDSDAVKNLCSEIILWAKKAKLYRLAEAALHALEKYDIKKATEFCLESLTSPIDSTILAIAAIRMIPRLDWEFVEPKVIDLISKTPDPYILLNLIDALSSSSIKTSAELIIVLMDRHVFEKDQELLFKLSGLLSSRADYHIIDGLIKMYDYAEEPKKPVILRLIGSLSFDKEFAENVGLFEFLNRILKEDEIHNKLRTAILLYKLGDGHSAKAIMELTKTGNIEHKTEIVRELRAVLRQDLLPHLVTFIHEDSVALHEELRETLLSLKSLEDRLLLVDLLIKTATEDPGAAKTLSPSSSAPRKSPPDTKGNKDNHRGHVEHRAVFFSDIRGYSKTEFSDIERDLSAFVREYDAIVASIVSIHGGMIVKKIGDSHLITFHSPLNAVLSGIRLQKAIKRFNIYRGEHNRISLRIGIHWGGITVSNGDVSGDTINIAYKLEKTAKEGTIYISEVVQTKIKDYVHSREIGRIHLKGIEKPTLIFEPYEINVSLLREKDPASTRIVHLPAGDGSGDLRIGPFCSACGKKIGTDEVEEYKKMYNGLKQSFKTLNKLLLDVEHGKASVKAIRTEMIASWRKVKRWNIQ